MEISKNKYSILVYGTVGDHSIPGPEGASKKGQLSVTPANLKKLPNKQTNKNFKKWLEESLAVRSMILKWVNAYLFEELHHAFSAAMCSALKRQPERHLCGRTRPWAKEAALFSLRHPT